MDGESDERRQQQNSHDANFVAAQRGMLHCPSSKRDGRSVRPSEMRRSEACCIVRARRCDKSGEWRSDLRCLDG